MIIHLYGKLGKKYGKKHEFFAATPQLAVRGLGSQLGREFLQDVRAGHFEVVRGSNRAKHKDFVSELDVSMNMGDKDLHITPRVEGSGGGIFQIIAGIALIVIGAFNIWNAGSGAIIAGVGMLAGGVAQMLAATPTATNYNNANAPDARASFIFNGAVNVIGQGGPVPVVYGRFIAGSTVISAGLDVGQIAY